MRIRQSISAVGLLAAFAIGCSNGTDNLAPSTVTLGNPDSLSYLLLPSSPGVPAGILLKWVAASDPNVTNYVVYAAIVGGGWNPVAYTGQTSYFVPGTPANQYYIASMDANQDVSSGTSPITVNTQQVLPPPDGLTSVPIDSGVKLTWSPDARLSNPAQFAYYRVYSEPAVVSGGTANCPAGSSGFGLEGSTVSEGYVVTGLANGSTWCFGVTTVATLGQESVLSPWITTSPSADSASFDVTASRITVGVHRAQTRPKK
jgi:hypothetical protein